MAGEKDSGLPEKAARLTRNALAVGSIALLGLGILIPASAGVLYSGARLAALGAGAGEGARRIAKKSK